MSFRPLTKTAAPMTVIEQMLIPAVYTGTDDSTVSAQLDLGAAGTGWGSGLIIVEVGNSGDELAAGLAITLVLEHCDTADVGSATAIDTNDLVVNDLVTEATGIFGLINAPDEDSTVFTVEYKANHPNAKRYINVRMDRSGIHATGTPVSITGIKYHPETASADGL